jgi:hypothetical protein
MVRRGRYVARKRKSISLCGPSGNLLVMRIATLVAIAVTIVGCILALAWPSGRMISRDFRCGSASEARARQVCEALAREAEWTWLGHAIVSPGWRVTWSSLRRVYCTERVVPADAPALDLLRRTTVDWRVEGGAEGLLRLLKGTEGTFVADHASIFNPQNPSYILAGGCGS